MAPFALPGPELLDQMAAAFVAGGRTQQARLQPIAANLLGCFVLLQMSWFGIRALLESTGGDRLGDILARLLRYILLVGFASWLLAAYDLVFYQGIQVGCDAVVTAVAGPQGETQSFATAWSVFLDLILSIWHTQEAVPAHFLSGGNPMRWEFWGTLIMLVLTSCLLLGTLLALVICLAMVAVVHVVGAAQIGLALALGPFFIPWLLWDQARSLFEGWLRFLFTACFYRVVAVTLLQLAKPVFQSFQSLIAAGAEPTQATSSLDLLLGGVMLCVLASVLAVLMMRVPQLTAALLGHGRIDPGVVAGAGRMLQGRTERVVTRLGGGSGKSGSGSRSTPGGAGS